MPAKTFAHITDSHLGQRLYSGNGLGDNKMTYIENATGHQQNLLHIFDDLARRGIQKVIFGGDIGTRAMNEWFFGTVTERRLDLQMVLGNHDTFAEVAKHYPPALTMGHQFLNDVTDDEYFRYIFLDTSDNQVDDTRMDWLMQMLGTDKRIMLFIHHPVLLIDTPVDKLGAALKGRDQLKAVLKSSSKSITIFCGHYHMADESADGNIQQFCTPAASYQIKKQTVDIQFDQDTFGYRIIEVNQDQLKTEVVLLKKN